MLLESQSGLAAVSDGMSIAVVGIVIVFTVLIILALVFMVFQKFMASQSNKACTTSCCSEAPVAASASNAPADVNAAIGVALYLYFNEQSSCESGLGSISKTDKRSSPWSSKIYGLNNLNFPR